MQFIKIILLSIFFCIAYGILHDQITARICVEYFTVGHPRIFNTESPTLLAFGWGLIATWWVGLLLGIPLAMVSRIGSWPKRTANSLLRPMLILMVVCALSAVIFGIIGSYLAKNGFVWLVEPISSKLPNDRHIPFLIDLWAHSASYFTVFLGGIITIICILISRYNKKK